MTTLPAPKPVGANEGAATVEAAEPEKRPSDAEVAKAVSELNKYVQSFHRELQFSVDEESGNTVIKVIDSHTKELIRQIPPGEVVTMARRMEEMVGLIVKTSA